MKTSEIQLGGLTVDAESGGLKDRQGKQVALRFQAREVLKKLAATPNEIVDRPILLSSVWQDRHGGEEGLVQCIAEIRKALGDAEKSMVETIPRRGYRLVPTADPAPERSIGGPARKMLAGFVVVALAAVALWAWLGGDGQVRRSVIAVLPFDQIGPDAGEAALGDSVAEDIIVSLARYSEFDVISRQSSFRFRSDPRAPAVIAELLEADYLVQGSQHMGGRDLRISVQLIDATTGKLAWVDRFQLSVEDMFETNDVIAFRIANAVSRTVVMLNASAPRPAGQVDALMLDNKARKLFQSGFSQDSWSQALEIHETAIADFPEAEWGYLGKALMLRAGVRFGWESGPGVDSLAEAEALARRSVELAPQNYMTHFALGRVLMQKGEILSSISALERAADLNPSSVTVLEALGQSYLYANELESLEKTLRQVEKIDPFPSLMFTWVSAWGEWQQGACEKARQTVRTMTAPPIEANKLIAAIHHCLGDVETATQLVDAYLQRNPDWTLGREITVNAGNWLHDGPRDRWLDALADAGVPD